MATQLQEKVIDEYIKQSDLGDQWGSGILKDNAKFVLSNIMSEERGTQLQDEVLSQFGKEQGGITFRDISQVAGFPTGMPLTAQGTLSDFRSPLAQSGLPEFENPALPGQKFPPLTGSPIQNPGVTTTDIDRTPPPPDPQEFIPAQKQGVQTTDIDVQPLPPEPQESIPDQGSQELGGADTALASLEEEAKKFNSAEEFVEAQQFPQVRIIPSIEKGKNVTYRGQPTGEKHIENVERTATYGKGLYTTKDIKQAKGYGDVHTVYGGIPNNPVVFRQYGEIYPWLIEQSGEKNIRDFNKKYDMADFVKSKGYDGIQIGSGKDAEFVLYPNAPKSQLTSIWNKAQGGK